MGRIFIRLALTISGIVVLAGLVLLFAVYSENNRLVVVAHKMMDDAGQLQVGKSSLGDVLAYSRKYNAAATGSWHEKPCTETDCLVIADAHQNDFAERHPKLGSLGTHISRRGWGFTTLMWVKDGKLDGVRQWFWFSTPTTNASVITNTSQASSKLCANPFFRLHPTFAAYEGPKHFAVWVDSSANAEKGMLKLNLNCAASIRGCQGVPEMAPLAWAKYESDRPFIDSAKWAEAAQDDNCR
jgi:hypothetical protein